MGRLIFIAGFIVFASYIVIGVFYVAEISWLNTSFFIEDNFWLWSLIICGALALFFFYISGKSYKDSKIQEAFFSQAMTENKISFNNSAKNSLIGRKDKNKMSFIEEDNEIDLTKLTMSALTKKMAFELTKPGPIFFKGWGNERLRLDVERVRIFQNYIESIRSTGDSLMELQADAFLSYEKVKALTEEKINQLQKRVNDSKIALDLAADEYTHVIEMRKLERMDRLEDIKIKMAQREQIETQNLVMKLKAEAEYMLMISKSEKENQVANILAEAVKYYHELPNVLKSFVATQLGGDGSQNPSVDMELQEHLKEFIVRKHKAETEMLEYEAGENKVLAEANKAKYKREKKKYTDDGNV